MVCPRGHTFDVARSGYINLLQPADRHSRNAGDSKAAVQARARLAAAGVGDRVFAQMTDRITDLLPGDAGSVIDLGCGSGEALDAVSRRRRITGIGIDLSSHAADYAARRFPGLTWIVANADRRLPVLTGGAALIMSLNGRRNPEECARVLKTEGYLVVSVPGPDDLVELRECVQGTSIERDRSISVLADHSNGFELIERMSLRQRQVLARESLLDLLRGTYRGRRTSQSAAVEELEGLEVTLAQEVLIFKVR